LLHKFALVDEQARSQLQREDAALEFLVSLLGQGQGRYFVGGG
jgi:hypothetical protein